MSTSANTAVPETVAVIGMSGRFPKARTLEEFWHNLQNGVEGISFFSGDDLVEAGVDPASLEAPGFVPAGGVLEDMDLFDASFFGFSARDAEIMDPQHRLFLECATHALDDAGYNPETYPGLIAVFAGESMSSYVFDLYANHELSGTLDDFQVGVGNEKDHLATQTSYKLNLRGPSMAVQTACSTSLVAVAMACQSLLNYQCDMALAGGVSADILTRRGYYYQHGGILSPDGHCRVFDAAAKGTVPGNGVGIVVLKRLSEAIADRDHIRAVIKGFGLNNDGSNKVGYTAPSVEGQAHVVALAQAVARVDPGTISYIEAHGTGTEMGDPIELAALRQVFRRSAGQEQSCAIGSVKSNIGHLDAAAGIAGFIKTILALEHKAIPPSLHFSRLNPKISLDDSPFYVNAKLTEWKNGNGPRRAGISCFGIGGTNAHVIVEEAPPPVLFPHVRTCCVLKLSARSSTALETATDDLKAYLEEHPDVDLADVAYTLDVGRRAFRNRRAVVCTESDAHAAATTLARRDPQRIFSAVCESRQRPVCFMFPGQGAQEVDMGLSVYRTEAGFRAQVDRCAEILRPQLGLDLRDLLYPNSESRAEAADRLSRTAFTQPVLFTVEYSLAKLWMEWGIRPSAMIGHSIGEYVAACLAGVFSLEDALGLVAFRGRLMDEMRPGGMLAVALSEPAAQRYVRDGISLAAVNGPTSCVLSGPLDEISRLEEQFSRNQTGHQRLRTSHAFHSSMMDAVIGPFVQRVRSVRRNPPQIPFQSNVTGDWITPQATIDPAYWGKHLRQTVRFSDGVEQLCGTSESVLLEVGPGQKLSNLARQQPKDGARPIVLSSLSSGTDSQTDAAALLGTRAKLWLHGVEGDGSGFHRDEQRCRIPLPGYPFERQRYWIESPQQQESRATDNTADGSRNIDEWFYYPAWKPALPPAPAEERNADGGKERWLIFADAAGVGIELARVFRERGETVTVVVAGTEFVRLEPGTWALRPEQRGDYDSLLSEGLSNNLPNRIVHLWGVTGIDGQKSDDDFERWQLRGFHSILRLVQALEKHYAAEPIKITVVSSQVQSVSGDEVVCPEKATVLGACRVIPQEYPNIRCQSVDIDVFGAGAGYVSRVTANLTAELLGPSFEAVVAWRKGRRWIQAFEHVRLHAVGGEQSRLRNGGTYLITGGLGKIGLVLAEHLARSAEAKLVLTTHSEFPPRSSWLKWLRRNPEGTTTARIRKLLELEECGSEVLVARADVADRGEMARVFAETEARFGTLHGVIHAAGDTQTISAITRTGLAEAAHQFRPKAAGLFVLDEFLRGRDLDFVMLLSSLSAVLGGLELAAYAAANTFLDAFARERNREGTIPWISVNWDGWQFPEQDGAEIDDSILPDEGQDAFQRVLDRAPRQVIVSVTDLEARLNEWVRIDHGGQSPDSAAEDLPQHSRPNLTVAYTAPRSDHERALVGIWQQLLGVAPIGIFDNFFELGGHSLLAIQMISRIRETFRIDFPVHRIFEAPTVAELAAGLAEVSADDDAKTAELLDLVEQLSDTEIAALLEEDDGAAEAKRYGA